MQGPVITDQSLISMTRLERFELQISWFVVDTYDIDFLIIDELAASPKAHTRKGCRLPAVDTTTNNARVVARPPVDQ